MSTSILRSLLASALMAAGPLNGHAQSESHHYGLRYNLALKPAQDRADVTIALDQRIKGNISQLRFHIDPDRHSNFSGDGTIEAEGEYVTWTPPESGGDFTFDVKVSHARPNARYDALMKDDWAIFRGDDLFPPAATEDHDLSEADAMLHVDLPKGWSFVAPYRKLKENTYEIEHAHRRFDRPTGWMAAGRLGVRREKISSVQVVVAGPLNQGVRRLDILALLNWNLPRLRKLLPDHMPERIVVVSAGDPMWRGGLSGPSSLFIHADRPLLSENGSSTLVHELIHVANRIEGEKGADWIVEGLAEYYCLKILWRSGTITDRRYKEAFDELAEWAAKAGPLNSDTSSGPVTARAVGIMRKLDHEIYKKTGHDKSLDDVHRALTAARQKVNLDRFRKAAEDVLGEPAEALSDKSLQ